jgi:hypothetical protein
MCGEEIIIRSMAPDVCGDCCETYDMYRFIPARGTGPIRTQDNQFEITVFDSESGKYVPLRQTSLSMLSRLRSLLEALGIPAETEEEILALVDKSRLEPEPQPSPHEEGGK